MPKKMDETWVHAVKTTEVQKDYIDASSPKGVSLILRVSRSGSKVWYARYRPVGLDVQRRFKLGTYPPMTLKEARAKASAIHAGLLHASDPAGDRERAKSAITFEDLAKEYMVRHGAKKRSASEDQRILDKDLLPAWKDKKAHDIRKRDVIALLDAIVARNAPIAANRTLALARKLFNFGLERDLIDMNPCFKVKAPSAENQRDRVLSEEEIVKVWHACGRVKGGPTGIMLRLRLLTAQRGGEVERMRWADLDLKARIWTIPAEVAKNGMSHRVPLSEPVLAILEAINESRKRPKRKGVAKQESPYVFPHRLDALRPITEIKTAVGVVREESGVSFVPHDLRRTAASWMASMGTPRLVISKILNHTDASITAVYDRHGYDTEKRQALDAWAMRLMEIVG